MVNVRRALEKLKLPGGLQHERVQWLYEGATSRPAGGGYLLYWMQTSVRTKHNYALEYAVAAANELKLPLHVVYLFPDRSVVPPRHPKDKTDEWKAQALQDANAHAFVTERHALFALEGLADAYQRLADRGLSLDVFHHQHRPCDCPTRKELLALAARKAALVVTDRPYLRPWRSALDALVSEAEDADDRDAGFGIVQVEGDVVVPTAVVTDKEEYAARTIRPKVKKHLDRYVVPLESLVIEQAHRTQGKSLLTVVGSSEQLKSLDVTSAKAVANALELLDVDHNVKGVDWHFRGGEAAASACAKKFLTPDKLASYATERNEPSLDAGSDLSVYLRYGHISVVRVALAAHTLEGVSRAKEGLASFLEELIVRRELSVNLVVYNQDNYDSMRCLPPYAQITLQEHADDKRDQLYSREKLESFQTRDRFWNAAQRELVVSGKMHGYMRMYWGKKLLEWTQTPEEGFNAALVLNNKYALDAPDPNSYAGVAWVFGKHDQGWKERPIFGKVRYMNEAGLKRKFRMDTYVLKVGRIAATAKKGTGEEEPSAPEEEMKAAKPRTRSAESDAVGSAKKKKLKHK